MTIESNAGESLLFQLPFPPREELYILFAYDRYNCWKLAPGKKWANAFSSREAAEREAERVYANGYYKFVEIVRIPEREQR
ncbi:MAG: hypothetical protein WC505_07325 [Patescibacteria group bacterium]